jgi:hypothetical protein
LDSERIDELVESIAAESRGALTAEYLWGEIASGRLALLIPDDDTVLLLRESVTPSGLKVAEFFGIAGQMKGWAKAYPRLEAEAKRRGNDRLRAEGRLGWAREARKYGWKMTRVIVEKDLHDA